VRSPSCIVYESQSESQGAEVESRRVLLAARASELDSDDTHCDVCPTSREVPWTNVDPQGMPLRILQEGGARPQCPENSPPPQHRSELLTIFAAPRSGTSLLSALLERHPEVNSFWELFKPHFMGHALQRATYCAGNSTRLWTASTSRLESPGKLLRQLLHSQPAGRWMQAYKIFPATDLVSSNVAFHRPQLPRHVIEKEIIHADWPGHFVILRRKNLLAAYVSQLLASQTGVWVAGEAGPHGNVTVDDRKFAAFERANLDWYAWLRRALQDANKPFLELTYEQISGSLPTALRMLLSFINVSSYSYDELCANQPGPLESGIVLSALVKPNRSTTFESHILNLDSLPTSLTRKHAA